MLLRDMIESIDAIADFVWGMTYEEYILSMKTTAAVERKLLIISEAVRRLGDHATELCPTQDWASIRGIGNFIRHEYEGIDHEVVWNTVQVKLPQLRNDVIDMMVADFKRSGLGQKATPSSQE